MLDIEVRHELLQYLCADRLGTGAEFNWIGTIRYGDIDANLCVIELVLLLIAVVAFVPSTAMMSGLGVLNVFIEI